MKQQKVKKPIEAPSTLHFEHEIEKKICAVVGIDFFKSWFTQKDENNRCSMRHLLCWCNDTNEWILGVKEHFVFSKLDQFVVQSELTKLNIRLEKI